MKKKFLKGLVAGFFVLGFAEMGQASIMYFDVPDVSLTSTSSFFVDPSLNPVLADYTPLGGSYTHVYNSFSNTEMPLLYGGAYWVINSGKADKLTAGTVIGASSPFGSTIALLEENGSGPWEGGGDGYVGFMKPFNGGNHYGYLHFNYDDAGNTLTLLDMAYESTFDQSIIAGAGSPVPIPGAVWLLGSGIAGLSALRRKKKA